MLRQTTIGKRNRGFEAPDLIDAFAALERQLASPEAGARVSPPARMRPRPATLTEDGRGRRLRAVAPTAQVDGG